MKFQVLIGLLSLGSVAFSALASDKDHYKPLEPSLRMAIGYADAELTVPGGSNSSTGVVFELGGDFNKVLGINLEYASFSDFSNTNISASVYGVSFDVGYAFPISSNLYIKPYGIIGGVRGDMDYLESQTSLTYGMGIRAYIGDNLYLSAETKFAEFDLFDARLITAKLGFRF
ncbi:porin family protein [Vibrio vulnificus]|nr:porin family protein [Vibrio vulnificus]